MSSNPISYTVDRRATRLRVTFRSPVVEDPAHYEMVCERLYSGGFGCQMPSASGVGYHRLRPGQACSVNRGSDGLSTRM